MTTSLWIALIIGIATGLVMAYGYGWVDGRDSMRKGGK